MPPDSDGPGPTGIVHAVQPEFLATCWTSAGDVMPLRGPDTSPLDERTRIEAVAATGYRGFGLTHADLVVARDSVLLRRRRSRAGGST